MFLHTHVYYANRFEPGVLFPDTIRLVYDNPMIAPDLGRILDFRLEFSGDQSADPEPISLSVTEENSFTLRPQYGHIALYYAGAPEDFDLADMIEGYTAVSIALPAEIDLPMQSDDFIGYADKDFVFAMESTNDLTLPLFTLNISQVYQANMFLGPYAPQSTANKGAVDMGSLIYPTTLSAGVDPNVITPSTININIVIN